jgi:hypothetical protein
MAKPEQELQISISDYLKLQYPKVVFLSESSGIRVSIGQAKKLQRMRSFDALPDMFIAFPNGKFHGLFIELKTEESSPYLKDGSISTKPHIQAQLKTLKKLHELGYAAVFGVGFNDTKKKIDNYFALKTSTLEEKNT